MWKVLAWAVVLILAAGVIGLPGEITGRVLSLSAFTLDPLSLDGFETVIEIDFLESGWTLGATASFTESEFEFVFFDAEGSLGAIDLYSVAGFDPFDWDAGGPLFEYWNNAVSISIAGIDFYATALLSNHWYYDAYWDDWDDLPNEVGTGLRIGGWGVAGDVTIYGEFQFNVDSYGDTDGPYWIWAHGFDGFVRTFIGHVKWGDWYGWSNWYWADSEFTPFEPTCTLPWSGTDFVLLAPFACSDLYVGLGFTRDVGFEYIKVMVERIDLGVSWLQLAYFGIWYEVDTKEPFWALDLVAAETFCVKPYLSLEADGSQFSIGGIALNALTLEYEVASGVTFKAGEKFTDEPWFDYVSWTEQWWTGWSARGEIAAWHDQLWEYGWDDLWSADNEEYLALEIAGDSCCGGQFNVFIYNWFDIEQTGVFMDWADTIVGMRLGIGSNTTLIFTIYVSPDGLYDIAVGMDLVW